MRQMIIMLALFVLTQVGNAQQRYKPLKIGDKVPDLALEFLNGNLQKTKLSSYKGKLLIVDCWNIYCSGCIAGFPKLSRIQQRFTDRLNIIALEGTTSKEKIIKFLEHRKSKGEPVPLRVAHIPSLKHNVLYDLFPALQAGYPLEIWINSKGTFIGSTDASSVNDQIINSVLGGNLSVLGQQQSQRDFDKDKPILIDNNGGPDSAFSYRSIITQYLDSIPKIGTDYYTKRSAKFTRIFFANRTIAELIKIAVYKGLKDNVNKLLELDVKDPNKYISRKLPGSALDKNTFCYELILPPDRTIDEAFDYMLEDLSRYFRIQAQILPRLKQCLIVGKIAKDAMKSSGETPSYKKEKINGITEVEAKNASFNQVLSLLGKPNYPIIVNETGIDYTVDFSLKVPDDYQFKKLRESLENAGLSLTERTMNKDVLVISEK